MISKESGPCGMMWPGVSDLLASKLVLEGVQSIAAGFWLP